MSPPFQERAEAGHAPPLTPHLCALPQLRQDSEDRQRIDLEKATLEGITLDDPTINEVPAIDDMQTVESDSPSFAQISSLAPEGRIFGAGS